MRTPKLKLAVLAIAAAFAGDAAAIDFLQTYRLARQNDAAFASARAGLEAGLEKLPQGRALLLPVINGTANTTWNDGENRTTGNAATFNSNGYNITLTQPIFRWQNIVQYKQSEFQVLQSEAQFGQATQDLVVRVAQAYFDVLAAQDNIEFIIANKIAIAEQLAQAKRNFEVGTATITDTNEAQARYDLAVAQEISGQNALEVAVRALQQIIGQLPDQLTPLKAVAMTVPSPNVMDEWANAARGNNFVVRGNEAVFEIATREIERQRAGHYPNIDVVASTQDNTNANLAAASALAGGTRTNISQNAIGLQLVAADLRRRLGAVADPRSGGAAGEGAPGPRGEQARRRVQRAPVVPQRHQRARAGEGARAGPRLERDRAAVEPRRLRGRRADQHRRAERAAAGVPDQARPRAGALRHDPERPAAQVGGRVADRERRRAGQLPARVRAWGEARAGADPADEAADRHARLAGKSRAGRA